MVNVCTLFCLSFASRCRVAVLFGFFTILSFLFCCSSPSTCCLLFRSSSSRFDVACDFLPDVQSSMATKQPLGVYRVVLQQPPLYSHSPAFKIHVMCFMHVQWWNRVCTGSPASINRPRLTCTNPLLYISFLVSPIPTTYKFKFIDNKSHPIISNGMKNGRWRQMKADEGGWRQRRMSEQISGWCCCTEKPHYPTSQSFFSTVRWLPGPHPFALSLMFRTSHRLSSPHPSYRQPAPTSQSIRMEEKCMRMCAQQWQNWWQPSNITLCVCVLS